MVSFIKEGKPWVNIQDKGGQVQDYQVRQVLEAIERLAGGKYV